MPLPDVDAFVGQDLLQVIRADSSLVQEDKIEEGERSEFPVHGNDLAVPVVPPSASPDNRPEFDQME